ncbi:MAG: YraN family protein [Candidatus Omnitrophica bacterium]|nr:YraN family protein [Candidatus Omnitrophota bacterium]
MRRLIETLRQLRGRQAERIACEYLRSCGYRIEDANVRSRFGELDLIAQEGGALCFVEVRSAQTGSPFGAPEASVGARKQAALTRVAGRYLEQRRPAWSGPVRFDVVGIERSSTGTPMIRLIKDAFDAAPSRGGWAAW